MRSELDLLINEPREDLGVEYKSWMDLSEDVNKAKIAKACIALANHGGGFVVIGFDEEVNTLNSAPRPTEVGDITQDSINSVIRRYAEPEFHCRLHSIRNKKTGIDHPVVAVPSNLLVPVMSKRACNGIIQQHRCYIRKSGPRSEEPLTEEEWKSLLKKCVFANHEELLNSIRSIVLGFEAKPVTPDSKTDFLEFRNSGMKRWQKLINNLPPDSPGRLDKGYYIVSIHPVESTLTESFDELKRRLTNARQILYTGWPPFLVEYDMREKINDNDHIEAWNGISTNDNVRLLSKHCDYWCASRSGQLFTVRGYSEDSLYNRPEISAGSIIDLTLPVWRIGEVLYFASRFLDEFKDVQTVLVNCKFTGLVDRTMKSITPDRSITTGPCSSDFVETDTSVTPQQFQGNMVEIVYQLLAPLYERFDFFQLTKLLVEEELNKLRSN